MGCCGCRPLGQPRCRNERHPRQTPAHAAPSQSRRPTAAGAPCLRTWAVRDSTSRCTCSRRQRWSRCWIASSPFLPHLRGRSNPAASSSRFSISVGSAVEHTIMHVDAKHARARVRLHLAAAKVVGDPPPAEKAAITTSFGDPQVGDGHVTSAESSTQIPARHSECTYPLDGSA